jgi:hypothetical protein
LGRESPFILGAHGTGGTGSLGEVSIDFTAMSKHVGDGSIYNAEIERRILLGDLLGGLARVKSGHEDIHGHPGSRKP